MSQSNLRNFLQNLDRSKLLGAEGAAELWQKSCDESEALTSAEAFAAWMVRQGNLTRHQADKLLRGHTHFFLDEYKITDQIGVGRMAGVYKAAHKLGMPVAVKILPPKSSKKPELLARFQREAELALQLDHPHVVKTYHSGISNGVHYIAMEYLEGETLEDRLKEKGKLPPAEVVRLADQTLKALQHLLEKGMVHRDVKPGNLMLVSLPGVSTAENPYSVKLLDVGLGRALFDDEELAGAHDLTNIGDSIGTPDYTAPEQTRDSHAADIRSDMYSLGCTLYECLAGRVPFQDKNTLNKLLMHAKEMPAPLTLGSYPQGEQLQAWLWKLMAKKPADRFQTPAEAAAALRQLFAANAPARRDTAAAERSTPQASRRRADESEREDAPPRRSGMKFVMIGSVAVVLLAVAAYFVITSRNKQNPSPESNKEVASVPTPTEEPRRGSPKETPKVVKGPEKKTETDPKVPAKKEEPDPKVVMKEPDPVPKVVVKEPDPKVVVKEPDPKVVVKNPDPEPNPKVEPKKDLVMEDKRTPLPPAEEIAKGDAAVKKVFGAEYAKTKAADLVALASKLLEEAPGTKDDGARYVMLRDARAIAARAGNAAIAMAAAEEMVANFQVNAAKVRITAADQIAAGNITPPVASEAMEVLLTAAEFARAEDDWSTAVAIARSAEAVARKSQSALLMPMAQNKLRELEWMKAEADKIKDQLITLREFPTDQVANFAVGRFHCLVKQDWDTGVMMLTKGVDERWRVNAELDVKAGTSGELEKVAAGDAWYDLIKAPDFGKYSLQARAHFWYVAALPGLTGLDKVKVEKRLTELQTSLDGRGGRIKLWMANRQAIVDNKIKKWPAVGGNPAMKEFEEIPKDGAILIGFYYTVTRNGVDPPNTIQPIYQSPRGEERGKTYGLLKPTDRIQVTKAKPGYAVGAILVRASNGRLHAIKPIYMKITDKGLDSNDRYTGQFIGEDVGGAGYVGDGNFIVGLNGKVNLDNSLGTLSVISLTTQAGSPVSSEMNKK